MHHFPFWARARCGEDGTPDPTGPFIGVGWSDRSMADARAHAAERARRIAAWWHTDGTIRRSWDYYPDRPVREPVLEELTDADGRTFARVTRNTYGVAVLNAESAMFIDVDRPPARSPVMAMIGRWFGRKPTPSEDPVDHLERIAHQHGHLGMRVYETAAGHRALVTTRTFDPASSGAKTILEDAGSDPLYVRLCKSQACFRARLTPKPWRVGVRPPRPGFPWPEAADPEGFAAWLAGYERAVAGRPVCRLVRTIGPGDVHADVRPVLEFHDAMACAGNGTLA